MRIGQGEKPEQYDLTASLKSIQMCEAINSQGTCKRFPKSVRSPFYYIFYINLTLRISLSPEFIIFYLYEEGVFYKEYRKKNEEKIERQKREVI